MRAVRLAVLALVAGLGVSSSALRARDVSTLDLLERYAAGEWEPVTSALADATDFDKIYDDLKDRSPLWIAAGGATERARRTLATATFALEAARVAAWREWKWIQRSESRLPVLYWKAAPRIVEWACRLVVSGGLARDIERLWQLAAIGVAQRAEDGQFLIGNTAVEGIEEAPPTVSAKPVPNLRLQSAPRRHPDEVLNTQHELKHLMHTQDRFPEEKRFMLAQGIARERATPAEAEAIYTSLVDDPAVGAEARVRLGALILRRNRTAEAIAQLERAERMTRDPYVVHLASFFKGQAFERLKQSDRAVVAYRSALAARPGTQSAAAALAALLFVEDQRLEAQSVMADAIAAHPPRPDPYLELMHADDRFWPYLTSRLRREIRR
jgi:tetratricopeptide (TPR) repeat protein